MSVQSVNFSRIVAFCQIFLSTLHTANINTLLKEDVVRFPKNL